MLGGNFSNFASSSARASSFCMKDGLAASKRSQMHLEIFRCLDHCSRPVVVCSHILPEDASSGHSLLTKLALSLRSRATQWRYFQARGGKFSTVALRHRAALVRKGCRRLHVKRARDTAGENRNEELGSLLCRPCVTIIAAA